MTRSLPDMGEWDAVFDESYLRMYVPFLDEERTREEARGAIALAEVGPGAEVLDCATSVPIAATSSRRLLAFDNPRMRLTVCESSTTERR